MPKKPNDTLQENDDKDSYLLLHQFRSLEAVVLSRLKFHLLAGAKDGVTESEAVQLLHLKCTVV